MKHALLILIMVIPALVFARSGQERIFIPNEIIKVLNMHYDVKRMGLKPVQTMVEVNFIINEETKSYSLGKGNRTLDLARFIGSRGKDFRFILGTELKFNDSTRLIFINRYQPLKISDQSLGVDCGKAMVVQSKLDQLFDIGLFLGVANGAYLNVIGGDYLLTHVEGKNLHVGYFRIRDNRWMNRLCKMGF